MQTIPVFDTIPKRILTSRESARLLEPALRTAVAQDPHYITLDFHDLEGIAPSVIDEIIGMFDELTVGLSPPRLDFENFPTVLTKTHQSIADAHHGRFSATQEGYWSFTYVETPARQSR